MHYEQEEGSCLPHLPPPPPPYCPDRPAHHPPYQGMSGRKGQSQNQSPNPVLPVMAHSPNIQAALCSSLSRERSRGKGFSLRGDSSTRLCTSARLHTSQEGIRSGSGDGPPQGPPYSQLVNLSPLPSTSRGPHTHVPPNDPGQGRSPSRQLEVSTGTFTNPTELTKA